MKSIKKILAFCEEKYDKETFEHCVRVSSYVRENPFFNYFSKTEQKFITAIALCHDLLEDTCVTFDEIEDAMGNTPYDALEVLSALTHRKGETYSEYIRRLRDNDTYGYAYIVKLADMKDHLMQRNTLSDKLKAKYWTAMPFLL